MSTLKSILVHVDGSARCAARLALAQQLAEQHDSAVTALFACTPIDLLYPFGLGPGMDAAALMQDAQAARRARALAAFNAAVATGQTRLTWAELRPDQGLSAFTQRALCTDLMVLGQPDPASGGAQDVPADFIEWTLIDSGKPALVLPFTATPTPPMHTALVAWKPSRESARALAAALPLLQTAHQVHLATWDDGLLPFDAETSPVLTYLQRHGVTARLQHQGAATPDLGDHLLSLAADLDAGLLVMGCYGHARVREWVTGGATRTVLASMTLPVLMSH